MQLILGSQSPRRAEILGFFSIPFEQIPSSFDEDSIRFKGDPASYVETLAEEKAKALSLDHPMDPILTADSTVFYNGKIFNKPKNIDEAIHFMQTLSGQWHSVFTGLCLIYKGETFKRRAETRILLHEITKEQIKAYLHQIHVLDKAGGFTVQQGGSLIVKKMEGCYYNVLGMPITPLKELLACIGIDLWQHIKTPS